LLYLAWITASQGRSELARTCKITVTHVCKSEIVTWPVMRNHVIPERITSELKYCVSFVILIPYRTEYKGTPIFFPMRKSENFPFLNKIEYIT
jgi:hypothetical protein